MYIEINCQLLEHDLAKLLAKKTVGRLVREDNMAQFFRPDVLPDANPQATHKGNLP